MDVSHCLSASSPWRCACLVIQRVEKTRFPLRRQVQFHSLLLQQEMIHFIPYLERVFQSSVPKAWNLRWGLSMETVCSKLHTARVSGSSGFSCPISRDHARCRCSVATDSIGTKATESAGLLPGRELVVVCNKPTGGRILLNETEEHICPRILGREPYHPVWHRESLSFTRENAFIGKLCSTSISTFGAFPDPGSDVGSIEASHPSWS